MSQDNLELLKNIGMQLQQISSQIQSMAKQMVNFNQFFGFQMQTMGNQISDIAIKIFNIGMQNQNQLPNPFLLKMINNQNNAQKEMINPFMDIGINNNINNILENSENKTVYIFFKNCVTGDKKGITINSQKTVEELLNEYRIRIGEPKDFYERYIFLVNGKVIRMDEKTTIFEYGLLNGSYITVSLNKNLEGGLFLNIENKVLK